MRLTCDLLPRLLAVRLIAGSLVLAVVGCGYRRVPLGGGGAPDFAIAVTPTASTAAAGTAAPAESFTLTRQNGFTGPVTVTGAAPGGISCAPGNCKIVIAGSAAPNALQFTIPASAQAGPVTLTFTATSGGITHVVTASLTIAGAANPPVPVAPPSPPVGPTPLADACAVPLGTAQPAYDATGFIATGSPTRPDTVFDTLHNRILATNLQLNAIDILSPESMSVVARLPMPQPMGLAISADGSSLIVGTRTHYFYQVSTASLCVTEREYLPPGFFLVFDLSPMFPAALADGSILFTALDVASTASSVVRWVPGSGFVQPPGLGSLAYSTRGIVVSGDRRHAYIAGADSGGYYGRFDVETGAVTVQDVAFGSQPNVLAANGDGSRILIENNCCSLEIVDGNFHVLATQSSLFLDDAVAAEPDFSRFYAMDIQQDYLTVLDAALKPESIVPFSLPAAYGDFGFPGFDRMHRMIATSPLGMFLINVAAVQPLPSASTQLPLVRIGTGEDGAMVPSTPDDGYRTTLNGAGFLPAPLLTFLEGISRVSVPGAVTTSGNVLSMTAPALSNGCFDVSAAFSPAASVLAPLAYCYSPMVDAIDGDAGPLSGGTTLTLYGRGFGSSATVAIGGAPATHVTVTDVYGGSGPYVRSRLTAAVPPGALGSADVVVSSSTGALLLKGAYTYTQREDAALPASAQPVQLIYDAARARMLVTDAQHDQLLVYGPGSAGLLESIRTGPNPQALALTPDGTRLLVTTAGDYKVSVLDASTYATLQQAVVPVSAPQFPTGSTPVGPPIEVATLAGNQALVKTEAGYLQGSAGAYSNPAVFVYDLSANALTADASATRLLGSGDFSVAASADGAFAIIGDQLVQAAGNTYFKVDTATGVGADIALSPDGYRAALDALIFDNGIRWQTTVSAPAPIPSGAADELFFAGMQLNASGSLLFRATAEHVRVYDTTHGILLRTVEVPGAITGSATQRLLALDPDGRRFFLATAAGISTFTFAADPLTVNRAVLSGSQLTVAGSGFQAGATLTIDLQVVACTVLTSTSIAAALPALAPGEHSVIVTNPDGHADTLSLAFTNE